MNLLSLENWWPLGHKLSVESDRRKILRALDIVEGRLPRFAACGDWDAWNDRRKYALRKKRAMMERLRAERAGDDVSAFPVRIRRRTIAPAPSPEGGDPNHPAMLCQSAGAISVQPTATP